RGGFISGFHFDTEGLDLDPSLADRLDPMFQLALHVGRAARRDARTERLDRDRVGVIFGNIVLPTETTSALAREVLGRAFAAKVLGDRLGPSEAPVTEPLNRFAAGLPAGLVARALGLGGGAYTLDAACASSLYALKLAADELRAGRLDAVLTGGLSRPDPLYTQMGFSQLRALSPSGKPRPFDAKGDGLVVGEGCGLFVLKRLDDALSHGDRILGLVAGVGLSNDLDGGLLAPSSEGQLRALRSAYDQSGWSPSDVDLIECHATGTPVGDAVEFASLKALWGSSAGSAGGCVVGSHKGNVGHTLTASGGAGLLKVLMALKRQTLPPTANFDEPSTQLGLDGSPFRILKRDEPWNPRASGVPRRAAVSGFGFGGINAHALIEEWSPSTRTLVSMPATPPSDEPIAVVGLGVQLGACRGLDAFVARRLGFGPEIEPAPSPNDWGVHSDDLGHHLDRLEVPTGRFRIPPRELEEMLPQQSLLLLAASDAVASAGWRGDQSRPRAGVFVGIGLDLNTTNYHVRWSVGRNAHEWGRAIGLEGAELDDWAASLVDAAGPALTANRTMGSLGGLIASRVAREFRIGGPSFTVSSEETSGLRALEIAVQRLRQAELDEAIVGAVDLTGDPRWRAAARRAGVHGLVRGDGAVALVLKRLRDAERDGDRVFALIRGVEGSSGGPIDPMVTTPDLPPWSTSTERVAAGRAPSPFGHVGAASGLLELLGAVVALDRRVEPPSPSAGPRFWLRDRVEGPRTARVAGEGVDGGRVHVIVQEYENGPITPSGTSATQGRPSLFVVEADDPSGLLTVLDDLESWIDPASDVASLARAWWARRPNDPSKRLGLAILADDPAGLASTVVEARRAVQGQPHLATRPGQARRETVHFEPEPLGTPGGVALVYPGLGNAYPGMGRAISAAWPEVFRRLDAETSRLRSQLAPAASWEGASAEHSDLRAPIMAQVVLGTAVTDLLASFGVRPSAVIGYSLGESSALCATRTWGDRDALHARLDASPLFRDELRGPCHAARRAWGLPPETPVDWTAGIVPAPAEAVRRAIKKIDHVYLLIINAPSECVIGGRRGEVRRLVETLGLVSRFVELPEVGTVHCPVAREVRDAYRELHRLRATPPDGVRFYSAGWGEAYRPDQETAADAIVTQAMDTVDFPAVIERAHADGLRVFIEVGPGSSCSRMIASILGGRPHFARSVCAAGADDPAAVVDLLARLVSHRVPVDLSSLFVPGPSASVPERVEGPSVVIPVGGRPFDPPVPLPAMTRSDHKGQPTVTDTTERDDPWTYAAVAEAPAFDPIAGQAVATETARGLAHAAFLRSSDSLSQTTSNHLAFQLALMDALLTSPAQPWIPPAPAFVPPPPSNGSEPVAEPARPRPAFDRERCLEFAVGAIGAVLGDAYAAIDAHPTRVRLPDEPLMLVDRIVLVEGEPLSMSHGRVVTEHDVLEGDWYLDGGKVPPCIAIESGQADLFLSAWLGVDFQTKGLAVYRLLDAAVIFHRGLPVPGDVIRYDIRSSQFFRQGDTHLFRFEFEGCVNGEPLLTMRDGCAGVFAPEALAAGQGIVKRPLDLRPLPGKRPDDWRDLVPMAVVSYDDAQIEALRRGDYARAFGEAFEGLGLAEPLTLPGGRMSLPHRVPLLDPTGGRYGLGLIRGELDVHPGDWFLTCHFIDDQVMPGTLMYECCLLTLRVFLLRMGWVSESAGVSYEPVPGVASRLRCRGQVIESTRKAVFEVVVKELGYGPEPFAIADALMYADGKPIVEVSDMTLKLSGLDRDRILRTWEGRAAAPARPLIFNREQVLAFATGNPSDAFGERYRPFDADRFVARLPAPPYSFLDRVVSTTVEPFVMAAGGEALVEYDVPADAWYFEAECGGVMPFAVLQEVALQACGWTSAYMGSALTSPLDLHFRNLGGEAVALADVVPTTGTLRTRVKVTKVANSAGMIVQHYDFETLAGSTPAHRGTTYFGFFRPEA
ncbi:MAG: beta-ketoacyl synthase N-terminal-like domain-containing protein, partial [Isosphaeraceae bacterium]